MCAVADCPARNEEHQQRHVWCNSDVYVRNWIFVHYGSNDDDDINDLCRVATELESIQTRKLLP